MDMSNNSKKKESIDFQNKYYIICPHCGKQNYITYWKCWYCDEIFQRTKPQNKTKNTKYRVYKPECLWYGWAWYIIVMLFSLILKEWYYVWISATLIFFTWRKQKINEGGI